MRAFRRLVLSLAILTCNAAGCATTTGAVGAGAGDQPMGNGVASSAPAGVVGSIIVYLNGQY